MAIQMRRGNKEDLDPSKLLPGEWAVSVDDDTHKQCVYMCFAPGVVKQMGTLDDFSVEIRDLINEQLDSINESVESCTTSAESASSSASIASTSAGTATTKASDASNNAIKSESYAIGGTGTRIGENTDNAKYYMEQAKNAVAHTTNAFVFIGTVTFADIPTTNLEVGYTYNISDNFTTDDRFKEGAGRFYPSGTDISWTADNKWDVLGGDMSAFLMKEGDASNTTVEFYEEEGLTNITSGSTISKVFGTVRKLISCFIMHLSEMATETSLGHVKLVNSTVVNVQGQAAIDAVQANASVSGSMANKIAKNTDDIAALNSSLSGSVTKYIDYNSSTVLFDGSSATDQTITVDSDGYISAESYNSTNVSKTLFLRIIINGNTVFEGYSEQRGYNYLYSGFFPVKKGDTVYIQGEGTSTGTGVHNMKLIHYSYY